MATTKQRSVSVRIPYTVSVDKSGIFAWAEDETMSESVSAHANTEAALRKKLRASAEEALRETHHGRRNWQRHIIGCGDGTVLVVNYKHGSWSYEIVGPGRKHSACVPLAATFRETIDCARSHAEQCFGGVAWDSYL